MECKGHERLGCTSRLGSRHIAAGLLQFVSGRSPDVYTRPPAAGAERSSSAHFQSRTERPCDAKFNPAPLATGSFKSAV